MASCELDYRLSSKLQSSNSEEIEDDGDSSEDEARLRIVENCEGGNHLTANRTFVRSLSVGDGSYSLGAPGGSSSHNASDAVESLLLLGQRPVFATDNQQESSGGGSDPGTSSGGLSPPFPRFSGNPVEQRMMVNYYQKMRERNNEASKRCRLKRRIKQDSLDKTKILLESHREALSHRVAKLHKIKNILNDACRSMGKDDSQCDCRTACNLIKAANREMPDLLDLSNQALVYKSRKVRETNMEEVLGAEAQVRLSDMRPLKRGPRKQEDLTSKILVENLSPSRAPILGSTGPLGASGALTGASGALDLSSSSFTANIATVKREVSGAEDKKFGQVTFVSKPYIPLAPKAPMNPVPLRKIIVDNPADKMRKLLVDTTGSGPVENLRKIIGEKALPILPNSSPQILPIFSSALQVGSSGGGGTIALPPFSGTNTIILTPLGQPGLPTTVFSLPSTSSSVAFSSFSSSSSTSSFSSSSPSSSPTVSIAIATPKLEPPVMIKSEPDLSIVEMADDQQVDVKEEEMERDPTTSCCASSSTEGACSQELVDVNSLTQMLDLVTMEPKLAGELTAAEKYIIKSRLRIEFWKAEETPSFICSSHRALLTGTNGLQVCSVCGKRKSKKFDMYFITYRMAVEFYMTEGKYLAIGRLACSGCKVKGLKGLDFSNSYLVPESGHPLEQEGRKRPREEEEEERRGSVVRRKEDEEEEARKVKKREEEEERRGEKREVVLQPVPPAQGKLATIQPLPPRPQPAGSLNPLSISLQQPSMGVNSSLGVNLLQTIGGVSSQQATRLTSSVVPAEGTDQQQGGPLQKLHAALALSNPAYKPPGFTITSLSECSEGVLQDAIHATETAVSTILSAIAPGQEPALWHHVSRSLQAKFSGPVQADRQVAATSKKTEDGK